MSKGYLTNRVVGTRPPVRGGLPVRGELPVRGGLPGDCVGDSRQKACTCSSAEYRTLPPGDPSRIGGRQPTILAL
jgi:hypothetical protein